MRRILFGLALLAAFAAGTAGCASQDAGPVNGEDVVVWDEFSAFQG